MPIKNHAVNILLLYTLPTTKKNAVVRLKSA
jgi:hypothetical protein